MNFSRFLDIQSWWEVPSIAYFCSLFRTAFNLLDFDIEELEEALLTDGTDDSGKSLLTELIVRLLKGSLGYHDISAFNYQMYLRRLFRKKCQNSGRYNPFNTDIDFQFLPLRTKVEILYALCDFRLDAEDVFDLFKNLEAESLRVEPLGWDDNDSAYWYFYGTRLYREDIKNPGKSKRRKSNRRRSWFYGDDYLQDTTTERVWQVVCFTEDDWINLTEKFRKATSKAEKELYRSLSINFLPEIPRLFQEKERQQRKRLLEVAPRRSSRRVQKIRRAEAERAGVHDATQETRRDDDDAEDPREVRARRRNLLRRARKEKRRRAAEAGSSSRARSADQDSASSAPRQRLSKKEKRRRAAEAGSSSRARSADQDSASPAPSPRLSKKEKRRRAAEAGSSSRARSADQDSASPAPSPRLSKKEKRRRAAEAGSSSRARSADQDSASPEPPPRLSKKEKRRRAAEAGSSSRARSADQDSASPEPPPRLSKKEKRRRAAEAGSSSRSRPADDDFSSPAPSPRRSKKSKRRRAKEAGSSSRSRPADEDSASPPPSPRRSRKEKRRRAAEAGSSSRSRPADDDSASPPPSPRHSRKAKRRRVAEAGSSSRSRPADEDSESPAPSPRHSREAKRRRAAEAGSSSRSRPADEDSASPPPSPRHQKLPDSDTSDDDDQAEPEPEPEAEPEPEEEQEPEDEPEPDPEPEADAEEDSEEEMPQRSSKASKGKEKRSNSSKRRESPPPPPPVRTGRKTNNSLACATGQIVIPDNDEPVNSTRRKIKTSQIFSQTEEDVQTDMYKVLEQLTHHEDAWPFMDPVEEDYAPNYYAVIRRPMDLHKMEERLDNGYYRDFDMFKADFKLIVNNCRLYNGQDNEYTTMVDNLQVAFDRLTEKYIHRPSSSDEEIAVEYQMPTPARKHRLKRDDSPPRHKRKKRRIETIVSGDLVKMKQSERDRILASLDRDDDTDDRGVKLPDTDPEDEPMPEVKRKEPKRDDESEEEKDDEDEIDDDEAPEPPEKKSKESHKHKDGKIKKKRKSHRHGKHSKNHKREHKSGKRKHSKKRAKKDAEGKREKRKKRRKHHEEEVIPEPVVEEVKRCPSPESIESSNRSRSASPLPSIHTPSPSPEPEPIEEQSKMELDPEPSDILSDPEFLKDKYDKIKERRRNAAKDAFESLLEYKQKVAEKQKHNLDIPHKDKNQKLKETIEKLKAKNRKISFNSMFSPGRSGLRRSRTTHTKTSKDFKDSDNDTSEKDEEEEKEKDEEEEEEVVIKKKRRKGGKRGRKSSAKNASATVALEQAVKDITEWFQEPPKNLVLSSPSDSPAQTISTEDHDSSRLDDESSQGERSLLSRRDATRKRHRVVKRREIQRTIDRLQPGKSKGNLLTNIAKNVEKTEEDVGTCSKVRDTSREESSPKLSLGSVLPTVEFTIGDDHKFSDKEEHTVQVHRAATPKPVEVSKEVKDEQTSTEELPVVQTALPNKKDAEVETEPQMTSKPSQEKATPNLSAWFKAFGAPKSTPSTAPKKKADDTEGEDKVEPSTSASINAKPAQAKVDSPIEPGTPAAEGGESPIAANAVRPRRTSTGSSVSERSSFSQDLDSPRHQMSHTSPLLRSPASPRTEDFQKITYPIINGSVRAGFYQDTTTTKSPDKSCSPREGPQSPYSPYSQHVYALNNATGSGTPNYFVDHNKSPLPTYGQNPPPYYDSSKVHMISKPPRAHDEFAAPAQPEAYQHPPYAPYPPPMQVLAPPPPPPPPPPSPQLPAESKPALFPVKKRTYNEPDVASIPAPPKIETEPKDPAMLSPPKSEFPKATHPPLPPLSVDDIALALSEKSEIAKAASLREKTGVGYTETATPENLTSAEPLQDAKKEASDVDPNKSVNLNKKDNIDIDMVNMGYMNTAETHEIDYSTRDVTKSNVNQLLRKGYEIEAVAINLGVNNPQQHKLISKANINTTPNMTPAHSQETTIPRAPIHTDLVNQNVAHVHHSQYDSLSSMQSISNFSMNDIELANKKLYASNTTSPATAIDYGNWKMTNPMRKQDNNMMPSDYSTNYSTTNEEKKMEVSSANSSAINYNKPAHSQAHTQYGNYNAPRTSLPRQQEIQQSVQAELRIPNPRGLLKADSIINASTINDADAIAKNMEAHAKAQKEKAALSMQYKTSYPMSSLPMDTLRNLPNYPRMLERYRNDERYLSSFPASPMYHDKAYQMADLFNKTIPASETHQAGTSMGYSQSAAPVNKETNIYKTQSSSPAQQPDPKPKTKRKRTVESKPAQVVSNQAYHTTPCGGDLLSSVKQGMMPTSAFNVGSTMNMAALSGMYADNGGYALVDDFRNSTNQLMAANYMAAAVAHQQRTETADKIAKPAHQNSNHTGSFSFIGPQVRAGYPFVGTDPSSPLYQQYLQRYQEELQRQTGAQIMGLYAPPYAPSLTVRQPYDTINRPTWL